MRPIHATQWMFVAVTVTLVVILIFDLLLPHTTLWQLRLMKHDPEKKEMETSTSRNLTQPNAYHDKNHMSQPKQTRKATDCLCKPKENATKIILFWTRYMTLRNGQHNPTLWWQTKKGYDEGLRKCEYSDCIFTDDKSQIERANLVLFSNDELEREGGDWPAYRSPGQLYIHLLGERPGPWHDFVRNYDNRINMTMNYRATADIPVSQFKLIKTETVQPYTLRIPLEDKQKMVVWPVSNCLAQSKRQDYVKELSKYISVDIYGECGNLTCSKDEKASCFSKWENEYKFYLSFENAICDDYITEKFFNPLEYELVPVTLSGDNYRFQVPQHAVLDARNFPHPRTLAAVLKQLAGNETAYSQYFDWKTSHVYWRWYAWNICQLCTVAHTVKNKPARRDYYDWWFSGCDNDLVERMRRHAHW